MDNAVIAECLRLSFADAPFPEVIRRLAAAGVAAYRADLIGLQKSYYDSGREHHRSAMPLSDAPAIAVAFDTSAVSATVKAIQRREIGYAEFLRRIMRAGCASYCVFLNGGKAMYFGRDGAFYTEPFPGDIA
jgi:uncharacterized protein YbcV (DUF1398 family)